MLKKMMQKKRIQDAQKFLNNIEPNVKHILNTDDINKIDNYIFDKLRTSHSAEVVISSYKSKVKEKKTSINPYCMDISLLVHVLTKSKSYIEKKYTIDLTKYSDQELKDIFNNNKNKDVLLAKYINEDFKGESYTNDDALYLSIRMRYLEVYLHFLTETDLIHE